MHGYMNVKYIFVFSCTWFFLTMVQMSRNLQQKVIFNYKIHSLTPRAFRWYYVCNFCYTL
jgi:hypothetical protein